MVADALLEANSCYDYLKYIEEPSKYVLLTDCILENIQHSNKPVFYYLFYEIATSKSKGDSGKNQK